MPINYSNNCLSPNPHGSHDTVYVKFCYIHNMKINLLTKVIILININYRPQISFFNNDFHHKQLFAKTKGLQ